MDSEFIGLYLDLYEGQKPELEIVASAAIQFSNLIKEVIFVLDPLAEVRGKLKAQHCIQINKG